MRKFLTTIVIIILILIALICLTQKLDILDFSALKVNEQEFSKYSDYYFDKLTTSQKEIYIKMDKAVKNKKGTVMLGIQEDTDFNEKITEVFTAYFYDNPQYYYISNEYIITTSDLKIFKYSTLKLKYIFEKEEIESKTQELENAINEILDETIKSGMNDFEKELAIHDALVEHIDYYQYEDINKIPAIKHTAYGALVDKEAVCDGYSKAFKMLLERVGIESVIVNGVANNVAHAWNLVKLDNDYYNVDVTSNNIKENTNKYVMHRYFNITDKDITKTHTIDTKFVRPECNSEKYNYYNYFRIYLDYSDNIYSKLKEIISKQDEEPILELKVDEKYYVKTIIDALYDLNFNNWRSSGKTTISYNKMEDVYVFIK